MQETPDGNHQPVYQTVSQVKQDRALEQHLEQLFSDTPSPASLPNPTRPLTLTSLTPSLGRSRPDWLVKATPIGLIVVMALLTGFLAMEVVKNVALSAPASSPLPNSRVSSSTPQPALPAATVTPWLSTLEPTESTTLLDATATPTAIILPAIVTPATAIPPLPTATASKTANDSADPLELKIRTATPKDVSLAPANPTTPTPVPSNGSASPPTRLQIPAIQLEAPIIAVGLVNYQIDGQAATTWAVPSRFAVGWHHFSAQPGQPGNLVLNGHQNIYGGVFRNLAALQTGDKIIVYAGDTPFSYHVIESHLLPEEGQPLSVRAQNAQWIMPTQDERLTLVTCAPDAQSTHRLIVLAYPATP